MQSLSELQSHRLNLSHQIDEHVQQINILQHQIREVEANIAPLKEQQRIISQQEEEKVIATAREQFNIAPSDAIIHDILNSYIPQCERINAVPTIRPGKQNSIEFVLRWHNSSKVISICKQNGNAWRGPRFLGNIFQCRFEKIVEVLRATESVLPLIHPPAAPAPDFD